MIKSNKLYDYAKFVALVLLPAFATLYFALSGVWNLPNTTQVLGTITAIDAFLGTVLNISNSQYKNDPYNFDGDLMVDTATSKTDPETTAVYNEHPRKFKENQTVTLRVKRVNTAPKRPSRVE